MVGEGIRFKRVPCDLSHGDLPVNKQRNMIEKTTFPQSNDVNGR